MSLEICGDVCWQGMEINLLKHEEKKIQKRLREMISISKET